MCAETNTVYMLTSTTCSHQATVNWRIAECLNKNSPHVQTAHLMMNRLSLHIIVIYCNILLSNNWKSTGKVTTVAIILTSVKWGCVYVCTYCSASLALPVTAAATPALCRLHCLALLYSTDRFTRLASLSRFVTPHRFTFALRYSSEVTTCRAACPNKLAVIYREARVKGPRST
jgi:hypothetical protein